MTDTSEDRPQLYLITPSQIDLPMFTDQLQNALDGGDVAVLQLRLKQTSNSDFRKAAEKLLPICHEHNVAFIINDRPDIAKDVKADGVHLGKDDGSIQRARDMLGPEVAIGVSCYDSRHRAMVAGEEGADYVAFGAFYPTETKEAEGQPKPDILRWWHTFATLPSVAIGGITPDNCGPLVEAGADFIAAVSAVWDHPESPRAAVAAFNDAIQTAWEKRNEN